MPAAVIREREDGSKELAPKLAHALKGRTGIMRALGEIFVDDAQNAFAEQGLDGQKWPVRYPNQAEPFINVAGAVKDLSQGPSIKPRRFVRRPAGIDTGALMKSIAYDIDGSKLTVGSPLDYATTMQKGGISRIPINGTVRQNLAKLMKTARKTFKKAGLGKNDGERRRIGAILKQRFGDDLTKRKKKPKGLLGKMFAKFKETKDKLLHGVTAKVGRGLVQKAAILKLGFLFREKGTKGAERAALNVKVVQRKFLGPSRQAMSDAKEAITDAILEAKP